MNADTRGESYLIPDVAVVGLIVRHKLGCLPDHFRVTRVLPQSLHGDHNRFGHLVGHHLSHHCLHLYSLTVLTILPRSPPCPQLCNPQTLIATSLSHSCFSRRPIAEVPRRQRGFSLNPSSPGGVRLRVPYVVTCLTWLFYFFGF